MTIKQLLIAVRSEQQTADEAIEACHRVEQGLPAVEPVYRLYFDDIETLWKNLTHRRMYLLQVLRRSGPLSIRKLAKTLNRDYKNVHSDITRLVLLDLIKCNKNRLYFVPWDLIDLQIPLAVDVA